MESIETTEPEHLEIPDAPEPKPRKVAILGYAPSSLKLAPFDDPEWEIWGLNELYHMIPRWDRWFEFHSAEVMSRTPTFKQYHAWLKAQTKPIYMADHYPGIPASVKYPLREVLKRFGGYFNNSISWMIALALLEGVQHIALYGVDMSTGTEYQDQRPSCEYMIGLARGAGVTVYVPPECDLLKCSWLYGFEEEPDHLKRLIAQKEDLDGRVARAEAEKLRVERDEWWLKGAQAANEDLIKRWGRG